MYYQLQTFYKCRLGNIVINSGVSLKFIAYALFWRIWSHLTKWVEAFPLPDQTSASIARLLIDHVVCRHGVPKQLLSDHGANLLSELMRDLCALTGMKKVNTTAGHPQTDGLVENFNKTLRAMLAKHSKAMGSNWDIHLQQLLFAYRTKPHMSTG